jgi:hypothetical protein
MVIASDSKRIISKSGPILGPHKAVKNAKKLREESDAGKTIITVK